MDPAEPCPQTPALVSRRLVLAILSQNTASLHGTCNTPTLFHINIHQSGAYTKCVYSKLAVFSTNALLQDFELEIAGAHMMKVQVCSKSLLKEETYAHGKIRVREREGVV